MAGRRGSPGYAADVSRLPRFEHHRYIGTRDTMVVYDCDSEDELAALEARMDEDGLLELNLVQTFGPDTLPEARNRGFVPT